MPRMKLLRILKGLHLYPFVGQSTRAFPSHHHYPQGIFEAIVKYQCQEIAIFGAVVPQVVGATFPPCGGKSQLLVLSTGGRKRTSVDRVFTRRVSTLTGNIS
jgi:hypothetical protein